MAKNAKNCRVPCPTCNAPGGKRCARMPPGTVHVQRRTLAAQVQDGGTTIVDGVAGMAETLRKAGARAQSRKARMPDRVERALKRVQELEAQVRERIDETAACLARSIAGRDWIDAEDACASLMRDLGELTGICDAAAEFVAEEPAVKEGT
jgi:hypothetical protein